MSRFWLVLLLALSACTRGRESRGLTAGVAHSAGLLSARQGVFERRMLLTGEIDAVSSVTLKVPRLPSGRAAIRHLEADGVVVKQGQVVAELDNAMFVAQLKERAIAVSQAEIEVKRQEWQNGLAETDRILEVERKKAAVERARIDADLPEGILPKREFLEKQMAVRKASAELEKAQGALASQRQTGALDLRLKVLALEKESRELRATEQLAEALVLRAPADGTVLVGDHWEGRKLDVGDEVWVGWTVMRMPDLRALRVVAWLADVDDGRIAPGMRAEVVLDAYPDRMLMGEVQEIAPLAREITDRSFRRVFSVSVALDGSHQGDLRPGISARVEVIAERKPEAVLVPRGALSLRNGQPAVHLASGQRAAVSLGACNPQECVVTAGVSAGARLWKVGP